MKKIIFTLNNGTSGRRNFLKKMLLAGVGLLIDPKKSAANSSTPSNKAEEHCKIYRALNGTPAENLEKVIELMGGVENLFGADDLVVIKPNLQWWNQGAPNLSAIHSLVEMIMNRPGGFEGEVVVAENCHRGPKPWKSPSAGWAHSFEWNSDIASIANMNQLGMLLKQKYGAKFSIVHWIDVGAGGERVYSPTVGVGYVYCDGTGGTPLLSLDNGAEGNDYRATIMTYPIFKTDKGTVVDLKNGVWENGIYTDKPLRFINFSALNHHSIYCGVTSSIKNYLGVSDISGGPNPQLNGRLTEQYHNFHAFPFDRWSSGPVPGMLGAEIGAYLSTVRRADLNITTAEWVGLSSRIEYPVAHTRTVLASSDPVALDFHAAKYVLYPNSKISEHNPENREGPVYEYLKSCADHGGGIFDERYVAIKSYDYKQKRMQKEKELEIIGTKHWGRDIKSLLKYLVFRFVV